jgi:hypothetical protein
MFCGKCGNQLPDDAKFCGKCGNKIEDKKKPVEDHKNEPIINETVDLPTYNRDDVRTEIKRTEYIPDTNPRVQSAEIKRKETNVTKKKSILLPIIIGCVALILVALGILAFIFREDLFGDGNEASKEKSEDTSENYFVSAENESLLTYESDEISVEESEQEGFVYGDSGILNGKWSLSTVNGEYELLLKLDGSAKLTVKNKGGSLVFFENEIEFLEKLNDVKDVLNIEEGEKISVLTDFRKNQIVIRYNNRFIILFHEKSQKIMPDDALSGYWRKGTDSFAINEEFITFKGDKNRYIALSETNFYIYDRLEESEFVFNTDVNFSGMLTECIIDENGYLDLFYAGVSYSNLRHVE